jgi:Domain of unknown function (DUF4365)
MLTLPKSHRQEALSRAYVRAIAAQVGVTCGDIVQDYGLDRYLRGIEEVNGGYRDIGPQIDLQLKSSTRAEERADEVASDLEVDAYNLLRLETVYRPCFLVLLVLPEDDSLWLTQSVDHLIVRRCAYGMSLRGAAATTNQDSIRVRFPRINVFSSELVQRWLAEARRRNGT